MADTAAEGGAESKPYDSEREYNGYTYYLHANTYNHLEGAHNDAALAVCDAVAAEASSSSSTLLPCSCTRKASAWPA